MWPHLCPQMTEVTAKLKGLHAELEKTHRGEDKYLTLVTEEHSILKEERELLLNFQQTERRERECFSKVCATMNGFITAFGSGPNRSMNSMSFQLSNAVRNSHEKERAQAEKTKYWSVLGSVIGACIGIIGTTINNRMRMRELR